MNIQLPGIKDTRSAGKIKATTIDPTTIDDELISASIENKKKTDEKMKRVIDDYASFHKLTELTLSFKNIKRISNLDGFERLEKLRLDNNIIEKIENLGHLTNLKWLDLSFNRITKIEGLDKLVKLTDLTLYNNKIKVLEGLDNLVELNVFSIGNNQIPHHDMVTSYLKKFKKLQVLNIVGNPVTTDPDYEKMIISGLRNLKYLDYTFIDEAMKEQMRPEAANANPDILAQKVAEEQERTSKELLDKLKDAKLYNLEKLAEELFNHPDLNDHLKIFAQVQDKIMEKADYIKEEYEKLQKKVLDKNAEKNTLTAKFELAVGIREKEGENETIEVLREFERKRKVVLKKFEKRDPEALNELENLKVHTQTVDAKLMEIETELSRNMDFAGSEFDLKLSKLVEDMKTSVEEEFFKSVKDNLADIQKEITVILNQEMETFAQVAKPEEEYTEAQQTMLENADSHATFIEEFKNSMDEKINKRLSDITMDMTQAGTAIKNYFKEREYNRSRKNVYNIQTLMEKFRREISDMIASIENNEDDN